MRADRTDVEEKRSLVVVDPSRFHWTDAAWAGCHQSFKAKGKDVVELEIGDSPFPSTRHALAAGIQAIVNAAQMIQLGEANLVLAGGMEAMSQAPFSIRGRDGFNLAPGGKLDWTPYRRTNSYHFSKT